MRPWFVRLHRWLGLALGAWVVMMSVTGFILVFQDQINAWLHPEWFAATVGDVGARAAMDAARDAYPEWTAYGVQLPESAGGVYAVGLEKLEEGRYLQVFLDPGTAAINGSHDYETGSSTSSTAYTTNCCSTTSPGSRPPPSSAGWEFCGWCP